MINKRTITVDNEQIEVNIVPATGQWVLVYANNTAQVCQQLNSGGKMETRNNVFEGANFDECQTEANRLGLNNASTLKELADKFSPSVSKKLNRKS